MLNHRDLWNQIIRKGYWQENKHDRHFLWNDIIKYHILKKHISLHVKNIPFGYCIPGGCFMFRCRPRAGDLSCLHASRPPGDGDRWCMRSSCAIVSRHRWFGAIITHQKEGSVSRERGTQALGGDLVFSNIMAQKKQVLKLWKSNPMGFWASILDLGVRRLKISKFL